MRVKHSIVVQAAEDTEMKNLLFSQDSTLAQVTIDSYQRAMSASLSIGAGLSENLSFGDIDAVKGIFLRVNKACTVNVNGLGTFSLVPTGTGSAAVAKLFLEAAISSISITVPGTEILSGVYCAWGDAES